MGCCDRLRRGIASATNTIGRGAGGLAKAALDLEPPPRAVLAGRAFQCFGAPGQSAPCERLGAGLLCLECGCLAFAKIRVASQECPLGKWGAVPPVQAVAVARGQEFPAMVRPPEV